MNREELSTRYFDLSTQILNGLRGQEHGLPISRSPIEVVSPEHWQRVPPGTRAVVANIAGTNWEHYLATKGDGGGLALDRRHRESYTEGNKAVSVTDFIDRMIAPVVAISTQEGNNGLPIGISLGFSHKNIRQENGDVDAELLRVKPNGEWEKNWKFTDWTGGTVDLAKAIRDRLQVHGIDPRSVIVLNDTVAVAADDDIGVLKPGDVHLGLVAGTGANIGFNRGELAHLNLGLATWADMTSQQMIDNGWVPAGQNNLGRQIGGLYLPWRLAAGLQLLGDTVVPGASDLAEEIHTASPDNQQLLSELAKSDPSVVGQLAHSTLRRTGQILGVSLAATLNALSEGGQPAQLPATVRAEGGVILDAPHVQQKAKETAMILGYPVEIVPAQGVKGIARLAMSQGE